MELLAEWKIWREQQVWEVPGCPGGIWRRDQKTQERGQG